MYTKSVGGEVTTLMSGMGSDKLEGPDGGADGAVYQLATPVAVKCTDSGTNGPTLSQYCNIPVTSGAGGVVRTRTVKWPRGLSQLPTMILAYTVYKPGTDVLIVDGVVVLVPPVAVAYQCVMESSGCPDESVTVNGTKEVPWQ